MSREYLAAAARAAAASRGEIFQFASSGLISAVRSIQLLPDQPWQVVIVPALVQEVQFVAAEMLVDRDRPVRVARRAELLAAPARCPTVRDCQYRGTTPLLRHHDLTSCRGESANLG